MPVRWPAGQDGTSTTCTWIQPRPSRGRRRPGGMPGPGWKRRWGCSRHPSSRSGTGPGATSNPATTSGAYVPCTVSGPSGCSCRDHPRGACPGRAHRHRPHGCRSPGTGSMACLRQRRGLPGSPGGEGPVARAGREGRRAGGRIRQRPPACAPSGKGQQGKRGGPDRSRRRARPAGGPPARPIRTRQRFVRAGACPSPCILDVAAGRTLGSASAGTGRGDSDTRGNPGRFGSIQRSRGIAQRPPANGRHRRPGCRGHHARCRRHGFSAAHRCL
jgi:hypothetical protein